MGFLGFGVLRFIPLKIWLLIGGVTLLVTFYWRYDYLKTTVKNYKAAVEIEQGRVDGNRQLVEELSTADDEIMINRQKNAEQRRNAFTRWLYQQKPTSDGKMPKGYVEHMNEVR